MGKLKKSVRGLVVVHPMTALGPGNGSERDDRFRPQRILIPSPLRTERAILSSLPTFLPSAGSIGPTNNFIHPPAVHKSVKTHHKHVA